MERTPHEIGDIMRQAPVSVFIRAGTARRSGNGIALVLGDRTFFLPPEEMGVLHSDRNAAIVREHGLDVPEICARAILQEIQTRQAVKGLMNAVRSDLCLIKKYS